MSTLDLGIVGNCTVAALIDAEASLVWGCFPRLDGDAVFSALLDGARPPERAADGAFALELVDQAGAEQAYLPNTAILRTVLKDSHGGAVEVVDFCPRFALFERVYRPPTIVRRVRPLAGRGHVPSSGVTAFAWG